MEISKINSVGQCILQFSKDMQYFKQLYLFKAVPTFQFEITSDHLSDEELDDLIQDWEVISY